MTSGSQWPQPVPGTRRRCSGRGPHLSEGETGVNMSLCWCSLDTRGRCRPTEQLESMSSQRFVDFCAWWRRYRVSVSCPPTLVCGRLLCQPEPRTPAALHPTSRATSSGTRPWTGLNFYVQACTTVTSCHMHWCWSQSNNQRREACRKNRCQWSGRRLVWSSSTLKLN